MRVSWLAALCLFALGASAAARPYSVDDMLALESYGQVLIDPSERWAVIERRGPWTRAASFEFGFRTVWLTARLEVVNLDRPGRPRPLFVQEEGAGYWSGGFSPSGRSMAVFRLTSGRLTLGILDMATRRVRWLETAPDLPVADQRPVWVDEDHLIFVGRPSGALPRPITTGFAQRRLTETFEQARLGREPSLTLYGAGSYRDVATDYAASTVVRADVRTGALETLLTGTIADLALAPGGRHLAVALRGEIVQPDPDRPVPSTFQPRRLRLAVIDLANDQVTRICGRCDLLPVLLSWSPDGSELVYFARRDGEDWPEGQLYRLGITGPSPVPVGPGLEIELREFGASLAFSVDWIDGVPIARGRARGSQTPFRWYRLARDGAAPLGGPGQGELVAASGRATWWIANGVLMRQAADGTTRIMAPVLANGLFVQDIHETGARAALNPGRADPLAMTLAAANGGARVDYIAPAAENASWSVPLPARESRLLAVARRGAAIIFTADALGVGTLSLLRPGRADIALDRINDRLAEVDRIERIAIEAPGPDGQWLTHWLSLPANSGPDTPLVVLPYPGLVRPAGPPRPIDPAHFASNINPALLAGAGFAVLEPSIPMAAQEGSEIIGSARQGGTFALRLRPSDADPAIRLTDIVVAAVEAAARTGRASGDRVALYGHSYGGWAALEIATRTDRFRAIVAAAGPYDYFVPYGYIPPEGDHRELGLSAALAFSFTEYGAGNVGGPPWRVPERYIAHSPLYAAERIASPVMLIHGDVDFMPYGSAARMLMAMHRLGRDAILLRYGGEGHVLFSPANVRDQWQRIFSFLHLYLDPTPGAQSPQ